MGGVGERGDARGSIFGTIEDGGPSWGRTSVDGWERWGADVSVLGWHLGAG